MQVGGSRSGLWIQEIPGGVMMIPSLARGCWRRWGGLKERYFGEKYKNIRSMQRDYKLGECIFLRRLRKIYVLDQLSDFGEITEL